MLKELHISNFAIIDDLSIPFGPGLNVLTGETGAGKSIIIEALGLIMGDKAPTDVIRSGEEEASVAAVFELQDHVHRSFVLSLSKDERQNSNELAVHGSTPRQARDAASSPRTIIVKRSVSGSGRSKVLLNGQAISIAELKKLSPFLLEISSQHEHQKLLNEETHVEFVDKFGDLVPLKEEYGAAWHHYIGLKTRLAELERLAASGTEQREFLNFQIKEISAAGLKAGEEDELLRERNMVKHAAELFEKVRLSEEMLYSSENSVEGMLDKISGLLEGAGEIDPSIKNWLTLCKQASVATGELARNLSGYLQGLDVEPARLEEIEARLYELKRLKKKYGGSEEDILKKKDEFTAKLNLIDNCDGEIEKTNEELKDARRSLEKIAAKLSNAREKSALKLAELVQKELDTLGLKKTTFAPGHMKLDIDEAGDSGIDRFSFMISPNPGEPLKPLSRIASGGELSRIMLAIKSVLMSKMGLASLEVFDEVDVGIGGATAEVVGRKLKEMAAKRQIICITHLPQAASFGDHHIVVSKETKGKRTVTSFELLDKESRVGEIARMLGGTQITKTTKEHAQEMLRRGTR